MEVNIKLDATLKGLDTKNKDFLAAIEFATTQTGLDAASVMRSLIVGGHKKGTPTPSRPGQPPTNVTGTLRRYISSNVKQGFGLSYIATVGSTVHYSRNLELGMGKNNVKYPFILPTARIMLTTGRARATYVRALRYALSK